MKRIKNSMVRFKIKLFNPTVPPQLLEKKLCKILNSTKNALINARRVQLVDHYEKNV